jgi:hypothetical protein
LESFDFKRTRWGKFANKDEISFQELWEYQNFSEKEIIEKLMMEEESRKTKLWIAIYAAIDRLAPTWNMKMKIIEANIDGKPSRRKELDEEPIDISPQTINQGKGDIFSI